MHDWCPGHHICDGKYHVFASIGKPVYDNHDLGFDISVDIPVGPVIIKLRGSIDFKTLAVDIQVYAKFPILPAILLGRLKGNLKDGVGISFSLPRISGELGLRVEDKWVVLDFESVVLGRIFDGKVKIFPIPLIQGDWILDT